MFRQKTLLKKPKHIAFNIKNIEYWAEINSKEIKQALDLSNNRILETVDNCIKKNIVIFTFNVLGTNYRINNFSDYMDSIVELLDNLSKNPLIHENKVKISVLGRWYDLPSKVVDSIKNVLNKTAEYDNYFLNLCLNYDGKEDIINALRVIIRSLQYEKIGPDQLSKSLVKENIYSSYFIPPDLMVNTHNNIMDNFLLWDSTEAIAYFTGQEWCDFDKKSFKKCLEFYKENK